MDGLTLPNVRDGVLSRIAVAIAGSYVVYLSAKYTYQRVTRKPQFPSPKPHPFVGHTFQVPAEKSWLYFKGLGKKLGKLLGNFSELINERCVQARSYTSR